jgi:hypothetical protein
MAPSFIVAVPLKTIVIKSLHPAKARHADIKINIMSIFMSGIDLRCGKWMAFIVYGLSAWVLHNRIKLTFSGNGRLNTCIQNNLKND